MKNNKPLPFERNRYYKGKLLTSLDFETEQTYINNKRRFLNQMLHGTGIVCGLHVERLDESSLLIESGVALDAGGREIVVDASVVKKLSALAGFDELKSEEAYLAIRYREEAVHPVYCAQGGQEEYEFNHLMEGYELYLTDAKKEEEPAQTFISEQILAENERVQLKVCIPAAIPLDGFAGVELIARSKSMTPFRLSVSGSLQLPSFVSGDGSHELKFSDVTFVFSGREEKKERYLIRPSAEAGMETKLLGEADAFLIRLDDEVIPAEKNIELPTKLVEYSAEELVHHFISGESLEKQEERLQNMPVYLARLTMLRSEYAYVIQSAEEVGVKHYLLNSKDLPQRSRLLSYFRKETGAAEQSKSGEAHAHPLHREQILPKNLPQIRSGRIEIPLNVNMKKGEVCYSPHIMHGLGKGNVFIWVGLEHFHEQQIGKHDQNHTFFGNPSLFQESGLMEVETAVKVYNDLGSFQVAAKLLGEQTSIVLQLSYIAIKLQDTNSAGELTDRMDARIVAENSTVRMQPRATYYFQVRFENIKEQRLTFELTEPGSGEITEDGVYHAPAKSGVYEILIYCTDQPKISTYAYAIVG